MEKSSFLTELMNFWRRSAPCRTQPDSHAQTNIWFSRKHLSDWIWWWWWWWFIFISGTSQTPSAAWSDYHPPTHICTFELFCEGFLQEKLFLWRPRSDRTFIFCVKVHFLSSQVYFVQSKVSPRDGAAASVPGNVTEEWTEEDRNVLIRI